MVVVESLSPKQLSFLDGEITVPSREIIGAGSEAEMVVDSIFRAHGVEEFSYTQYNPFSTYPIDGDQPFWRSCWSGIEAIRELSDKIYNESLTTYQFEGDIIAMCNILGIGSQVKVGGEVKHMRMLDFEFREPRIDLSVGKIETIGLPRGVVLKTDESFHYYGLDLASEDEWRSWINRLIRLENSVELFGFTYLKMCLERGYNALRIYSYEHTFKEKTPVVIAKI